MWVLWSRPTLVSTSLVQSTAPRALAEADVAARPRLRNRSQHHTTLRRPTSHTPSPLDPPPAKALKLVIKQPRPVGAKKYGKRYGMPSTHSSSMAYFGVYLSLCSLFLPLHKRVTALIPGLDYLALKAAVGEDVWQAALYDYTQFATRAALAAFFLGGAASVCWSRVRLGHHTRAQVIAGASLGAVVATAWLATYLGLARFGEVTGTTQWTAPLLAKLGELGVPARLTAGFTSQGQKVEDAVMGSVWEVKKAWDEGRWEAVRAVDPRSLPVWTTNWREEL